MVDAIPNSPYNNGKDNLGVKVATPQYILFDDAGVSIENMTRLVFEDIGSEEIINVARNDTVFGENLVYQPIVNSKNITLQAFLLCRAQLVDILETLQLNCPVRFQMLDQGRMVSLFTSTPVLEI